MQEQIPEEGSNLWLYYQLSHKIEDIEEILQQDSFYTEDVFAELYELREILKALKVQEGTL